MKPLKLNHVKGDLLTSDCVIRCQQVNCRGVMGAGIALQIKQKYPEVYEPYKALCEKFGSKLLGEVQFIACHDGTIMANLFAQDDYDSRKPQTNMKALEECLMRVAAFAAKTNASVAFPKLMGAGLAGGDWSKIYLLIEAYFSMGDEACYVVEWDGTQSSSPKTPQKEQSSKGAEKADVVIYTDGACRGNPGPGGWGCILLFKGVEKEFSGGTAMTTNNQMELMAVIEALKALQRPCNVTLYSDSSYVVNAATKWLEGWKRYGWKKKDGELKNVELWQELDQELHRHKVTFIWVKGHADNEYNNRCDKLATKQADKYRKNKA